MDDHTRSCWPWLDHGLRRTHVLGEGGFGAVYLCHRRNKPGQDGQGPTRSSISRGYYGFLLCNCGYSWDETGQTCNMPMNSGNNHNDVWFWSFTMFSYSIQWWFWIIDGFFRCQTHPNRIHQHRVSTSGFYCVSHWDGHRKSNELGIHLPQGSSMH
jgi:hypothetical protein